jgi:hypothetical protein
METNRSGHRWAAERELVALAGGGARYGAAQETAGTSTGGGARAAGRRYKAVLAVAARALVLVLRLRAYAGAIEDLGMVSWTWTRKGGGGAVEAWGGHWTGNPRWHCVRTRSPIALVGQHKW